MNHLTPENITSWTVERIKSLDDDSFCAEARAFLMYAQAHRKGMSEEGLRHIIQQGAVKSYAQIRLQALAE